MNEDNFKKQYAHLITYTNFRLAESIGERITDGNNDEELRRKADDSAFGYEFGQLFPNSEKPFGIVIDTNPLKILAFEELSSNIIDTIDRFEYDEKKKEWGWYKNKIVWCVPNREEMRLIFDNHQIINNSIDNAPQPSSDGWEWDDDEDEWIPLFKVKSEPNPFKRDKIQEYSVYMTRDRYRDEYWHAISKFGEEHCNWVESTKCRTRIIGIVGENVLRN